MSEENIIPVPETVDGIIEQYVQLRDRLKQADDEHKKKTKFAKDHLEKLEGLLMERLNDLGGESIKTPHGTVYRSTKRSATIADGDAFRKFVVEHEAFDIVDWRANANAVDDFIKSQATTPPGVNFTTTHRVGVRRA
jgi:hypothetical protein